MPILILLIKQISVMFLLASIGFILFRRNVISEEGCRILGNIVIYIVLPCVILNSFLSNDLHSNPKIFLLCFVICFICLLASIIISRLLCGKDPVDAFAATFPSTGFFSVPLVSAVISPEAVLYIVPFVVLVNVLQFTYGAAILSGDPSKMQLKAFLKAPVFIASAFGLIFALANFRLPMVFQSCVDYAAAANTFLGMIILGTYIAKSNLKETLQRIRLYWISSIRLMIIPFLTILILALIPSMYNTIKIAILITAASPVGSNVGLYADLYDKDYIYGGQTVVISTLISIITIPIIVAIANLLWSVS